MHKTNTAANGETSEARDVCLWGRVGDAKDTLAMAGV